MKKDHDECVKMEEYGQPTTWRQRNAKREWKQMQHTLNESNKKCNFCQESGHRVLTCPERLGKVEMLRKINKVYKPLLHKTLKDLGFGKGCLIVNEEWVTVNGEHEKREVPYMVTGIEQGALDFCNLREGFGEMICTSMFDMKQRSFPLPHVVRWAVTQAVCHVDTHPWGDTYYSNAARQHPFRQKVRSISPPSEAQATRIIGPSDDGFCVDSMCYPLEKKKDINKMFREEKTRKDRGRFYTDEYTHNFVGELFAMLRDLKGWEL